MYSKNITLFVFASLMYFSPNFTFAKVSFTLKNDTLLKVKKEIKKKSIEFQNNETPSIIKRGEKLVIEVKDETQKKVVVRLHSSLGRLIKEYGEVEKKIIVPTDTFLPGLYLVIIKKTNAREVRKVLITE
jgi:hypothetical protein